MDCFICHFAPLLRPLPLHGAGLATGATARPTRTSRILPDVILTLVHSTRLLPWVVKIMSVPRSVSRATVAPYARRQLKVRWNRLKGREIAGPAIDLRASVSPRETITTAKCLSCDCRSLRTPSDRFAARASPSGDTAVNWKRISPK